MKLHEQLNISLTEIDEAMEQVVLSDPDLPEQSVISTSIIRLIRSGGKRLRPILVMIGGRFGNHDDKAKTRLIKSAVLMEYIHMASLIHDDIIDDAHTRRGEPALHIQTNVQTAVQIADFMIARAIEWSSSDSSEDDHQLISSVVSLISQLCIGEYGQLEQTFNFDQTLRQYLRKTRKKTAVLIASCLKTGAELTGADDKTVRLLTYIGDAIGMAFQIQDDILDFTQDEQTLGKPAGSDLRSGNITLPVLYAMQDPELASRIRSLTPASPEPAFREAIDHILASPACSQAAALRDRYITCAEGWIDRLSHYEAHKDLKILLQTMAKRTA